MDLSRTSIRTFWFRSKNLDVAKCDRALAQAFFDLKISITFKSLKLLDNSFTFCKCWDIMRSLAWNRPRIYSTMSWKLIKTLSFLTSSSFTNLSLVISASYSVLLFEVLKLNLKACSVITPSGLVRIKPASLSFEFEAPSTCNTQLESSTISYGFSRSTFC